MAGSRTGSWPEVRITPIIAVMRKNRKMIRPRIASLFCLNSSHSSSKRVCFGAKGDSNVCWVLVIGYWVLVARYGFFNHQSTIANHQSSKSYPRVYNEIEEI